MDEETEEAMTPMVDALTGAMASLMLVTIFVILSTFSSYSDALKQYQKEQLAKTQIKVFEFFNSNRTYVHTELDKIIFVKSYSLSEIDKLELENIFMVKTPKSIKVYSNDSNDVITYNILRFINDVGLIDRIDKIEVIYLSQQESSDITTIQWEW